MAKLPVEAKLPAEAELPEEEGELPEEVVQPRQRNGGVSGADADAMAISPQMAEAMALVSDMDGAAPLGEATEGDTAEVVDEWEAPSPEAVAGDAAGGESPGWDVPEQIDPIMTPRQQREPEPEPEQQVPIACPVPPRRKAPLRTSLAQGGMMGLGASVVFFNHERPAEATGGIEALERRRRQIEESAKDRETFALLEDVLAEHWLTNGLTQDVRASLVDSMLRRDVAPGERVVSRGDEGSCLLVLGSGQCGVTSADAGSDDSDGEEQANGNGAGGSGGALTRLLEPGDCMGAAMLVMPGHMHVATVRAATQSVIWSLERARFQDLVHSRTAAALQIRMELLRACPWLSSLDEEQLGRLAAVGRLHCCPVGARSVFDRAPAQMKPRCRYVLEEPDEGPDDFDWVGDAPSLPQEPVYDYRNSAGALPTAGSVRPLRSQALTPTAQSPTTVLVERISDGDGEGGDGRELQLLAISGAAFSWLLGEEVSSELQTAISLEYPMTPEEAEAEIVREMEREEEALAARIKAAKMQAKGPPRPSAAAMSMASALASYGAAPAKSSPGGAKQRRGGGGKGRKNGRQQGAGGTSSSPSPSFEPLGQLGVTAAAGMAEEAHMRMMAHKLAEKERTRRVEQIQIDSLEFFTPSHLARDRPSQPPEMPLVDSDDEDAVAAQQHLREEREEQEEGRSYFNAGRLAYQAPSHEGQLPGRYIYVRATAKRALSALGAERRWLHSLRLWAELPPSPGLLALAGAGESKRHLYTMTVWDGGESLAAAAARGVGGGMGAFRLKRKAVAFYVAQIIGALDVLHAQRIVYRSLTPASLLLDSCGHIQLGSFGLAKRLGATAAIC